MSHDPRTVVFVPYSELSDPVSAFGTEDGGTVTTPRELTKMQDLYPTDEMFEAAIEIEGESHLAELFEEHFESGRFARERRRYMDRASDEKLLEDYRERIRKALSLCRGHVPERFEKTDRLDVLREYHEGLQGDINFAQDHIDCAVAIRRNIG